MMEISLRNEEMNDHLSLLLQGYAAKRKLAELFQSEGFVQENTTANEARLSAPGF
jgi:hypothetical protein